MTISVISSVQDSLSLGFYGTLPSAVLLSLNMAKDEPLLSNAAGRAGAASYSTFALLIYDYFVLKFMSHFIWRCSTSAVTLPFFRRHIRPSSHLDIGVGTGYFLQHSNLPADAQITLCDLNSNCLEKAKVRLERQDLDCLQHDILEPLPRDIGTFDSISLMFLLHCLPPPQSRKGQVLSMLKHHLKADGVLFGCTVLGPQSGNQTWASRRALRRINAKGRMGNLEDREQVFVEVLRKNYAQVETLVVGSMLLFTARKPIL